MHLPLSFRTKGRGRYAKNKTPAQKKKKKDTNRKKKSHKAKFLF